MTVPFTIRESSVDENGIVRLTFAGDIDLASVPAIRAHTRRHLSDAAVVGISIDLTAATFIDSAGVGALVGFLQRASTAEKALRVVNARGRVKTVLDISGLTPLLSTESGPGRCD